MRKIEVIQNTILAAQAIITNLNNGQKLDTSSLDKWTEALLKYVLNDNQWDYNPFPYERTLAQYIENLQFKADDGGNNAQIIQILNNMIAGIEKAGNTLVAVGVDLDQEIQYQPIFNRD